jgi:hypothetical protein
MSNERDAERACPAIADAVVRSRLGVPLPRNRIDFFWLSAPVCPRCSHQLYKLDTFVLLLVNRRCCRQLDPSASRRS